MKKTIIAGLAAMSVIGGNIIIPSVSAYTPTQEALCAVADTCSINIAKKDAEESYLNYTYKEGENSR